LLTPSLVADALADVPEEWLADASEFGGVEPLRQAYARQLLERLAARSQWFPALTRTVAAG
jgi:hypothetical protein